MCHHLLLLRYRCHLQNDRSCNIVGRSKIGQLGKSSSVHDISLDTQESIRQRVAASRARSSSLTQRFTRQMQTPQVVFDADDSMKMEDVNSGEQEPEIMDQSEAEDSEMESESWSEVQHDNLQDDIADGEHRVECEGEEPDSVVTEDQMKEVIKKGHRKEDIAD